jgi:hypothetical protein
VHESKNDISGFNQYCLWSKVKPRINDCMNDLSLQP